MTTMYARIYIVENIWFDLISGRTRNEAITSAAQLLPLLAAKDIEEMAVLYHELASKNKIVLASQKIRIHRCFGPSNYGIA